MSYILDALRRSQAERDRGQVPGLDAQPAAPVSPPEPTRGGPLLWLAAGLGLGGLLALGLWWSRGPADAAPVAALQAPVHAPAPATATANLPTTAPTTAPATAPTTAPATVPVPLPVVVSVPPSPSPPSPLPEAASPKPESRPAPPPAAVPAPAQPRATPLADVSEQLRRDMPPLAIGGSVWSESVLGRFVIVNGQVVREGETAAPGVTVERIAPRSVVMRWRELRFEVPL